MEDPTIQPLGWSCLGCFSCAGCSFSAFAFYIGMAGVLEALPQ
ncbi:MAG: hypothetical protein Q4D92_03245 [Slackia sp.]|nr:hypothetical protein [Slackia sp.]